MSNYKHNLLLSACHSGLATTNECERMSYAAGMWACGEHKITRTEVLLAETVLARNSVADAGKSLAVLEAENMGYLQAAKNGAAEGAAKADKFIADTTCVSHPQDYDAEYTEEVDPSDGEGMVRVTATSGLNLGRKFLVKKTDSGFIRGHRTYSSLAAAAGGYAPK